jgi:hypothetical protein
MESTPVASEASNTKLFPAIGAVRTPVPEALTVSW